MKRIIAMLVIIIMVFPVYALDLIIMKNGDTYLGSILSMDVNDKVVINLQDGTLVDVKFKDINSIKKIDTEQSAVAATPNIVIQNTNTNTNENIIGISSLPQEKLGPMVYVPREKGLFKYSAPRITFRGVSYNVDDNKKNPSNGLDKDYESFLEVVKTSQPNLDPEISRLIREIELNLPAKVNFRKWTSIGSVGGLGLCAIGLGMMASQEAMYGDMEENNQMPGATVFLVGSVSAITSLIAATVTPENHLDGQKLVMALVDRYNHLYDD